MRWLLGISSAEHATSELLVGLLFPFFVINILGMTLSASILAFDTWKLICLDVCCVPSSIEYFVSLFSTCRPLYFADIFGSNVVHGSLAFHPKRQIVSSSCTVASYLFKNGS
jgi:hypothetical protein